MPTPVSNVYPGSSTYTHEVALALPSGLKYGLRLRDGVGSIRDNAPQTTSPVDQVSQISYHLGRGLESFLNKSRHFGYWDAKDAWLQTLGKAHPTLLWRFGLGLRSQDLHWFGSVEWRKISTNGDPYLSVSFASSGFTGRHIQFPIRRRGNPGTLTVTLRPNDAGEPHSITFHQSVTITKSDIPDTPMVIFDGEPTAFALVASTTYHLVFASSDTDDDNCWEIGCDAAAAGKRSADNSTWTATAYSPYYRLTDADTERRLHPFFFDGAMYVVDSPLSGAASSLYINGGRGKATSGTALSLVDGALNMTADRYTGAWIQIIRGTGAGQARQITDNNTTAFTVSPAWSVNPSSDSEYVVYASNWFHKVGATGINGFTNAAVGASGLGYVYSQPAVVNGIAYFPQGDSVGMRRMQWNSSTKVHNFGSEAATGNQGTASFVEAGFDPADGPQLWRANNTDATGSGGAKTASRAKAVGWGVALAFLLPNATGTKGIYIGSTNTLITGIRFHNGSLFVHKEDNLFTVSNDRAVAREYPAKDMPSIYNGQAMIIAGDPLYISFQTNLMQLIGGTISDTRLWLSNLPATRVGYVRGGISALGWVFVALDAGVEGTSSVMIWSNETQSWHECLRGFEVGRRIRSVFWQPNDETNPFLWTEIGGELIYQVFPRTPRPINDPSVQYMPECVLELSTIDLNTNPKFFGKLSAVTKNLSDSGMEIFVDYQMDNYVGGSTWFQAGTFVESPEDSIEIGVGNKRKLRPRFRMNTSVSTTPPILEQWSMEFFERTPFARYISLDCEVAPGQTTIHGGGQDHKPTELFRALEEMAKGAQVIRLESIDGTLHGKSATMYMPPHAEKTSADKRSKEWTGTVRAFLYIPSKEEAVK
ncbi:MAG: hypothetical protein EHM40_02760 [Chloroflexi bacterium]|nr:MAG: hypothetical protein EHM40_02760 [Chloroflexota bacterium]